MIQDYLYLRSWALFGTCIFFAVKEFLQAFEEVMFANFVYLIAVFLNVLLNFIFVFGLWGFPRMDMLGLALSSFLIRSILAVALLIYSGKYLLKSWQYNRQIMKKIFRVGWPIACTLFAEIAGFCAMTFIIARISTLQTAAHNIVVTLASITFMVPLAVSSAASVKIGHAFGEKNMFRIVNYSQGSLFLSVSFMLVMGVLFYIFPKFFIGLFSADSEVIHVGIPMIIVVAFFQIFDGAQVTLGGIIRGLHISKPIFITQTVAFWGIGLPLGIYLAYYQHKEALGLWLGFALALAFSAGCLTIVLKVILRKLNKKWASV